MSLDPRKYLIKDLVNKPAPLDVWLQGTIEQTVGADILIISDSTGHRTHILLTEKNANSIQYLVERLCTYCCIIGTAIRTKGLPEVQASKFIDLTAEPHMKIAWEAEVKEAELFLEGKLIPTI